ncbi:MULTISPECIES: sensor histidine kinase [Stutzerimonas stutzeri subgroup]|jgi:signal transduction histidine kinase|uniref:sensor histidine kinase n=1 Tax=Stutzerimonas stutzeri subgroup TaxID=578833 RepID=UPI00062823BE|nr:sensor histidine kinase [Stutzerimonas kunmingensis]KKJ95240.1 histidine kinase [Stutzerimonas stutzeri]MAF88330.1 sensor histidine kinase [Pseudomonas sp.]MBU0920471.1 sensor histidine kinase [Gammaproteobacteria bacterium]MAK87038.1 sensor histidine kinase [Pseudomonas sp.]MBD3876194.1 sensor histidine kinase [Stutzerimonas kunmingensis]|tara:strand:+ start:1061 stop:2200 length:1140 start_codon:yes stop_codon:yes gene_type:complete
MRLADFILENIEPILQQWEDFAKTMTPAANGMDSVALRDHAEQMLLAIAADLRTAQSVKARIAKSHGKASPSRDATPAETHADIRYSSGFTIAQVIAEYRALRTSVLVLWMSSDAASKEHEISDIVRFNEAIDQSLAESVVSYADAVDAARNVFLGILGHDLRSPLGAILLSADVLLRTGDLPPKPTINVSRIYTSVKRSIKIVGDLLDFTRTHSGVGIPVRMDSEDLALACEGMVEEARAYNPDRQIVLQSEPSLPGQFDKSRMEQVIANLIGNAVEHGEAGTPITVSLKSDEGIAALTVHNVGRPIAESAKSSLFNPMVRHIQSGNAEYGAGAGLGLGLYIASAIVDAHHGSIEFESMAGSGTTFTVRIPLGGEQAA